MAFELTDTNPFSTNFLSVTSTDRPGFTFNPDYLTEDFSKWKESVLGDLSKDSVSLTVLDKYLSSTPVSDVSSAITAQSLYGIKSQAQKQMAAGAALKTLASAGQLFSDLLVASSNWKNINRQRDNTKLEADVQMKALDNQILDFKNRIADKFNKTMAKNAVTLATKNLRVTAGNLLEQTKGAAQEATYDIRMAESNAELKKILLRSQQRQADISAKLMKSQEMTTLLNDFANLGLMIGTKGGTFADSWSEDVFKPLGIDTTGFDNAWGNIKSWFKSDDNSLNDTIYGG